MITKKTLALALLAKLQTYIILPIGVWAMKGLDVPKVETAAGEYVEPSAWINAGVVMMAQKDREAYLAAHPELFQAELNGLMEAMRAASLNKQLTLFFGSLMQQGYPPEECMLRSAANSLHLGMFLQKRIGETV